MDTDKDSIEPLEMRADEQIDRLLYRARSAKSVVKFFVRRHNNATP